MLSARRRLQTVGIGSWHFPQLGASLLSIRLDHGRNLKGLIGAVLLLWYLSAASGLGAKCFLVMSKGPARPSTFRPVVWLGYKHTFDLLKGA